MLLESGAGLDRIGAGDIGLCRDLGPFDLRQQPVQWKERAHFLAAARTRVEMGLEGAPLGRLERTERVRACPLTEVIVDVAHSQHLSLFEGAT
jgi:hypothetical protein